MKRVLLFFAILSCFLFGCKDKKSSDNDKKVKGNSSIQKNNSTGATAEILVLSEGKRVWTGLKDSVNRYFEQPLDGMPQPESMFKAIYAEILDFNRNDLLKRHHSILNMELDSTLTEPKLTMYANPWAQPQIVFTIKAPTVKLAYKMLRENGELMVKEYKMIEYKKAISSFSGQQDAELENIILKKFGFSMIVPKGFYVGEDKEDFLWLRQTLSLRKQDRDLGILIYKIPYRDTNVFNTERLLNMRDFYTKQYISSQAEGSYMLTDRVNVPVVGRRVKDFATGFAFETRGIWYMENDFMGGAYVNYAFVSPDGENLISIDGFVYNPGNDKRNYIYQLEAIFSTIKFVNQNKK